MKRIDKNRSMLANKIFLVFRTISERQRFTVNWQGVIEFEFPVKPTKNNVRFNDEIYKDSLSFSVRIEMLFHSEITGRKQIEIGQSLYFFDRMIAFHSFRKMRQNTEKYKIDIQRQIIVESIGWLKDFENFFHFLEIEPDLDRFNEKEYLGHNNPEMIG